MNALLDDIQPVQCLRDTIAAESHSNYATEFEPVSIVRRWCDGHQTTHLFQVRRKPVRKRLRMTTKARDVLALFFIGEMIAFAAVAVAASAIAAVR